MSNANSISVAVLITCHNRKEATLKCLKSLSEQKYHNISIDVYVVDDGSSDGTTKAIRENYFDVIVLKGNGNLYWNGGMRLAFKTAIGKKYDYYLWLNDDTVLYGGVIDKLFYHSSKNMGVILVGSVCDVITKKLTYGGLKQVSKILPLRFAPIFPSENELKNCDTMNGNCVLIPESAARILGNLSPEFTHSIGDFDYGLRAKEKGIKCLVVPGFVGECSRNSIPDCFNSKVPLIKRLKSLYTPKGLPPKEWFFFTRRHAPYIWLLYLFKLYTRVIFLR